MKMEEYKQDGRVIFTDADGQHSEHPEWYPLQGTVGRLAENNANTVTVQWPTGSTSSDDRWRCSPDSLELIGGKDDEGV